MKAGKYKSVRAAPPYGLGYSPEALELLIAGRKSPAVVSAIEIKNKEESRQGKRTDLEKDRPNFVDNVHEVERPSGNAQARAIRAVQ